MLVNIFNTRGSKIIKYRFLWGYNDTCDAKTFGYVAKSVTLFYVYPMKALAFSIRVQLLKTTYILKIVLKIYGNTWFDKELNLLIFCSLLCFYYIYISFMFLYHVLLWSSFEEHQYLCQHIMEMLCKKTVNLFYWILIQEYSGLSTFQNIFEGDFV